MLYCLIQEIHFEVFYVAIARGPAPLQKYRIVTLSLMLLKAFQGSRIGILQEKTLFHHLEGED